MGSENPLIARPDLLPSLEKKELERRRIEPGARNMKEISVSLSKRCPRTGYEK